MQGLTELQRSALDIIKTRTIQAPITGRKLQELIKLDPKSPEKPGADMRSVINALRSKYWPICANSNGYYWPSNANELMDYIKQLEGRIKEQEDALEGVKNGFNKLGMEYDDIASQRKRAGWYQITENGVDRVVRVDENHIDQFIMDHPKAVKKQ
jgi:hypothetical protein